MYVKKQRMCMIRNTVKSQTETYRTQLSKI